MTDNDKNIAKDILITMMDKKIGELYIQIQKTTKISHLMLFAKHTKQY